MTLSAALALAMLLPLAAALRREMTVEVRPRTEECFYITLGEVGRLTVEYQVLDSEGATGLLGDLTINFRCVAPMERRGDGTQAAAVLLAEYSKEEGYHNFQARQAGDHKLCFDNQASFLHSKVVYFSIETDEVEEERVGGDHFYQELEEQRFLEDAEDIQASLRRITAGLRASLGLQSRIKATSTRDRGLAESNFERVNRMSLFYLVLILCSGLLQTVLVKNLFEDPRKDTLWRRLAAALQ